MIRAFVAVPLEDAVVRRRLAGARSLLPPLRGVRWVPETHLHFTVRFLGDVDGERLADLRAAVAEAARGGGPFRLSLAGLGAFPPRGPARVLWAGCGEGGDALSTLASTVEEAFSRLGFPPEARPFSPHLTLARVKDVEAGRRLARALPTLPPEPFGDVDVSALVLFRSDLSPRGPDYTELFRAELQPPPALA